MLLAKVAGSSPKLDYSKILEVWETVGRRVMCREGLAYQMCGRLLFLSWGGCCYREPKS